MTARVIDWNDAAVADGHLRAALAEAAAAIEADPRPLADLREEDLRGVLYRALARRLPGRVRKERSLRLSAFRGVGGFDVLVDRGAGGPAVWLAEVKWSYTSRSKIHESVWDAVKLCLAADEHRTSRSWLVTGAPRDQWATAEAAELFASGTADFLSLWTQPLVPPGPNGGGTSGADLLAGGRGNRFTRAPAAFAVQTVGTEEIRRGDTVWDSRAVAVHAAGDWIEDFAVPPAFPASIRQPWLDAHVPAMSTEQAPRRLILACPGRGLTGLTVRQSGCHGGHRGCCGSSGSRALATTTSGRARNSSTNRRV
ncbi:MAG TPA: hypothetical protein VF533_05975 [Solirubrobacteraceae bacterium]